MDLINLNSPLVRTKTNFDMKSPLIPSPNSFVTSEVENNPFDAVVNVVEINQQPNDPFDLVLQRSMQKFECGKETVNNEKQSFESCDNESNTKQKTGLSDQENLTSKEDIIKIKNNVKEFVSERINSCVRRSFNSSVSTSELKSNSAQNSLQRSNSTNGVNTNNIGIVRKQCNSGSYLNTSLPSDNRMLSTMHLTAGFTVEKVDIKDLVKNDLDNFQLTKKHLKREANKIARMLRNEPLNTSSEASENDSNDSNEKLWNTRPPWETDDDLLLTDEEDSIGLPRLRLSHSFSGFTNGPLVKEDVINKYKQKRLSTDLGQLKKDKELDNSLNADCFTTDDEVAGSSSCKINSDVEQTKIAKESKTNEINLGNDVINAQSLRPKKKNFGECMRKGPMKAVIPLQKMSKNITAKLSSPFKNKSKIQPLNNNKKDESLSESMVNPVASSTPTKSQSPVSSAQIRGRDNNKSSPTGRKATRSNSVEIMENRNRTLDSPIKASKSAADSKVESVKVSSSPKTTPDDTNQDKSVANFKRVALKSLTSKQGKGNTEALKKVKSKIKFPRKQSIQDKENHCAMKS